MFLLSCISSLKKSFSFCLILFFLTPFFFLTPAPVFAGCSDVEIDSKWSVEGGVWDGKIVYGQVTIGRCYKFLRGCSVFHCSKSKKQIYDLVVQAVKNSYPTYEGKFCLVGNKFVGYSSVTKLDYWIGGLDNISSWGVPRCQTFK